MAMVAPAPSGAVWKFGYGSNMSQEFLRTKKMMEPLDCKRSSILGFQLSFPEGKGMDFIEPAFATMKRDPAGVVHGVSTLFSREDADKLDKQEPYAIEVVSATIYGTGEQLPVEVYVPRTPLPLDFPEGCCSERYRAILVRGAVENELDAAWIAQLQALPTYTPSAETLALRVAIPPPSALPQMSIDELLTHDGETEGKECRTAACGYVFAHVPLLKAYKGRDVTMRNVLHVRGINLDSNDDGGVSFPRLSQLAPIELEYALQAGVPIAVLREFWEGQEKELSGVFQDNSLSKL